MNATTPNLFPALTMLARAESALVGMSERMSMGPNLDVLGAIFGEQIRVDIIALHNSALSPSEKGEIAYSMSPEGILDSIRSLNPHIFRGGVP